MGRFVILFFFLVDLPRPFWCRDCWRTLSSNRKRRDIYCRAIFTAALSFPWRVSSRASTFSGLFLHKLRFFLRKFFLFQPVFGTRSHWKTIVTHRSRNRSWRCSPSFCCCSWAITTVTWKIPCEKHSLASAIPKVRSVIFPLFILGNESDAEGSHHLDWLIDWLSNSIVDRSFHWLIDWSICCSIDWSIDWLMGWFPFLDFLFGRLIDWSIC